MSISILVKACRDPIICCVCREDMHDERLSCRCGYRVSLRCLFTDDLDTWEGAKDALVDAQERDFDCPLCGTNYDGKVTTELHELLDNMRAEFVRNVKACDIVSELEEFAETCPAIEGYSDQNALQDDFADSYVIDTSVCGEWLWLRDEVMQGLVNASDFAETKVTYGVSKLKLELLEMLNSDIDGACHDVDTEEHFSLVWEPHHRVSKLPSLDAFKFIVDSQHVDRDWLVENLYDMTDQQRSYLAEYWLAEGFRSYRVPLTDELIEHVMPSWPKHDPMRNAIAKLFWDERK